LGSACRYETAYVEERIPEDVLSSWRHAPTGGAIDDNIHLPAENSFIAENFDLFEPDADVDGADEEPDLRVDGGIPTLVVNSSALRLWHHQDRVFKVPKATIKIRMISPVAAESPHARAVTMIFASLVKDAMNSYSYFAELSGGCATHTCVMVGTGIPEQRY